MTTQVFQVDNKSKDFQNSCVYCGQAHSSSKCRRVTDIKQRKDILRKNGRCYICIRRGHVARQCKFNYLCVKCSKKHHICDSEAHKDNKYFIFQGDNTRRSRFSLTRMFDLTNLVLFWFITD